MDDTIRVDELTQRPARYWTEDGLPYLMLGISWILTSATFLVASVFPKGSLASQVYSMVAPILWGAACIATTWRIKTLKARFTSPRAGYVALQEPTAKFWAAFVPVFLIAAG